MPVSSKPTSESPVTGVAYLDPDTSSRIELTPAVMTLLNENRQLRVWHKERGGLLFVDIAVNHHVLVADASPPHRADRAGRASLVLDHNRCLEDINQRFQSGLRFVGYWHTHPERYPALSNDDIYAFSRNLRNRGLGLEQMLAVVVGSSHELNGISVSLVAKKRVHKLEPIR